MNTKFQMFKNDVIDFLFGSHNISKIQDQIDSASTVSQVVERTVIAYGERAEYMKISQSESEHIAMGAIQTAANLHGIQIEVLADIQ